MGRGDTVSKRRPRGTRAVAHGYGSACCRASGESAVIVCSTDNTLCDFCKAKLFAGITGKRLEVLGRRLTNCRSPARLMLFRAGDASQYLYVIREGQVKLTRMDIDGHEHLLDIAGPGYFLGFDAIGNSSYTYSAETLTPCMFCRIRHGDIVPLLNEEPRVSLNVLLAVNEQLGQARKLMRVLGRKTAAEKVAALLLNLYPSKTDGETGKVGGLHLSRQEMAKILGLTVETVSRIMAALRRKGVINAPRGRIVISARGRLQALAGGSLVTPPSRRKAATPRKRRSRRDPGRGQNLRLS